MKLPQRRAVHFALAAIVFCSVFSAFAQRPGADPRLHVPTGVAISPDGSTVAWTLGSRTGATLHLSDAANPDSAKDRLIAPNGAGNCANSSPVWSPDGQTLAFLGACAPESKDPTVPRQSQIYLWSKSTGEVRQLTHVTGDINQPAWSPDGKSIAFLFVENATRTAGALDAMKPWSGVIGEDNVEVQRVYAIEVASGRGEWITGAAKLHVYEFDWAPDSRNIAYIAAPAPGENTWWIAKLFTQTIGQIDVCTWDPSTNKPFMCKGDGAPMGAPQVVLDPNTTKSALHGLQIAVPRWSPDGKRLAVIGGLMSDQGSTGGDIWVVDAKGGQPVDITPGIDGTPTWEAWLNDHTVGFVEDRRGHILLTDADANAHHVVPGSSDDLGEVSISGGGPIKNAVSASRTGFIAYVQSSLTHAPEIFVGPPGKAMQFTHLNASVNPDTKTESIEWDNEGFHVQGWLTLPANYDPAKKYPMIVQVHGGPSSSIGPQFNMGSMWAKAGYFLFQPNPRGSYGQGEAFTQANRKDFGYGDLRDILKGMDTIEAKYPVDKNREGLTGWSYGGFMTMFAVTQTTRFRAAVAGAGLSDWLSYYGENSIDQWMIPFFGASVYDDPAVYAKSSAINFIKKVKTPTLVIVGDRDGECPAPQSFEFWHALRDLGVKTQLVVYPDEGHGFRNPEHIRDRNEREIKWFAENMPAK